MPNHNDRNDNVPEDDSIIQEIAINAVNHMIEQVRDRFGVTENEALRMLLKAALKDAAELEFLYKQGAAHD